MDWSAPIATIIGACVGVGSTLAVDRAKWHRDRQQRLREERRTVYADFLTALHRARENLWSLARDEAQTDKPREVAAREAIPNARIYSVGEVLLISAPQPIINAVEMSLERLRGLRDVVKDGFSADSLEFRQAEDSYTAALMELRATIRQDLGVATLDPD